MHADDVRLAVMDMAVPIEMLHRGLSGSPTGLIGDGRSLLPELARLDAMVEVIKTARLAVLRHERRIGTSWGEISTATGTCISTWRFRHDKGVLGA